MLNVLFKMSTTSQKKIIYVKQTFNPELLKQKIEKKLEKLYPVSDLLVKELEYDFDIDEEFKKQIDYKDTSINLNLINNLPTIKFGTNIKINDDYNEDLNEDNNDLETETNDEAEELEIDISSLEKELVGDKWYYFDHTKGIIYDTKYNAIGNIDDLGEIILES